MSIHIVRGAEAETLLQDEEFRAQWLRLFKSCHWSTTYQGHAYASLWYRVYRDRYEPLLVVSRDPEARLNGLLSLAVSVNDGGLIVVGGGKAEYHAWLCHPGIQDTFACQALLLLKMRFRNAILRFRYLPPGTPTKWIASSQFGTNCKLEVHRRPLLQLKDGDTIAQLLKKKSVKRLQKMGKVEFKRIVDVSEFEELYDQIIDCYDSRHSAVHNTAPFRNDSLKRMFTLELMKTPGMLHATVLKVNGQFGAAHLGACENDEVHLGLITHNPLFDQASPGKCHILFLAKMLFEEGYTRLDLTAGNDSYKDQLANAVDEVHTLSVYFSRWQRTRESLQKRFVELVKNTAMALRIDRILQKKLFQCGTY